MYRSGVWHLATMVAVAVGVLPGLALAQSGAAPAAKAAQTPAAHPTVVTLANGDRVSGLLAPSDPSALHLMSEVFGDLALPWKGVASIEFGDAVAVTLADGRRVTGPATFKREGALVIKDAAGETVVEVAAITSLAWIAQPGPTWRDYWNVSAASQLYASRGNSGETDFGGNFSITRQDERNRLGFYASRRFSNASDGDTFSETSDNATAGIRIDRNFSERGFGFVSTDLQHDRFQQLRRLWFAAGAGWNVVARRTESFTALVGVSRGRDQQRGLVSGTGTGLDGRAVEVSRSYNELQLGESLRLQLGRERGVFMQDLTVYRQLGSASVKADAGVAGGVSNRRPIDGNLRAQFSAMLQLQLSSWLGWQLSVQDSYNRHTYPGVDSNDLTISAGLTFSVGRKGMSPYGGASSNVGRKVTGGLPRR